MFCSLSTLLDAIYRHCKCSTFGVQNTVCGGALTDLREDGALRIVATYMSMTIYNVDYFYPFECKYKLHCAEIFNLTNIRIVT